MTDNIAERYARFARVEARGRSPLYEALAEHVAAAPDIRRFLMGLPRDRQQPNLLFAATRFVAGTPLSAEDFERRLRDNADAFADAMAGAGVAWLCNESPRVFPQFSAKTPPADDGSFLLTLNGRPLAWTAPHGETVRWIGTA